ncbi:hypothetical protein STCU_11906 [Strigomonas culicis]|uniref:RanBP2-type domain-containing protein n=1 Tax=Strigomonas culicis TaxID=28005 RepID=S9TFB0_9TRYP|nr:hypothetical protein STCU_11906 [Strigomonas culicis]|eukprot:EPY15589.1 hypothetical protein STCU_11906 [Strigomonas culicis]
MARNSVRNIFVDWQCAHCLSLNFSRNIKCFGCSAPYDVARCTAVFSGKLPPEPPLMDPHHEVYMERFGLAA